jgi:hypothetical protein
MKKNLTLTLLFLLIISGINSQVLRKRYFRDSKVYISLPTTFILGSTTGLNDFTQNEPNILITLNAKSGSYNSQVDKMLQWITLTGGTKDMITKDITHHDQPAKYVMFDQLIAEGLPWYRHQHIIFGNDQMAIEIMAVYPKDSKLEKIVEEYLLSSGIDQ